MEHNYITDINEFVKDEIYFKDDANKLLFRYLQVNYNLTNHLYVKSTLYIDIKIFDKKHDYWYFDNIRKATEQEIIWFEYCESISEYRELEEALDYYHVKQFIQEYLI